MAQGGTHHGMSLLGPHILVYLPQKGRAHILVYLSQQGGERQVSEQPLRLLLHGRRVYADHLQLKHQLLACQHVVGVDLDPLLAHLQHHGHGTIRKLHQQAALQATLVFVPPLQPLYFGVVSGHSKQQLALPLTPRCLQDCGLPHCQTPDRLIKTLEQLVAHHLTGPNLKGEGLPRVPGGLQHLPLVILAIEVDCNDISDGSNSYDVIS
mmetsp:Transcript_5170/g.11257  ORF Transcript_5170/g.11257 Transcript_5170/m.11257 type:complete len:209 (+) Transcript_5170:408-1034(+)